MRPTLGLKPANDDVALVSKSQDDFTPDVVAMYAVLLKRKWFIVAGVIIGLIIGAAYTVVARRTYAATAVLNIHPEGSDTLKLADVPGVGGGLDWNAKLETQAKILTSDTIAWKVIQQLHLDSDKSFLARSPKLLEQAGTTMDDRRKDSLVRLFLSSLTVETVPRTQLIQVKFRHGDPQLAARIVNAITSAYVERNYTTRFEATAQASNWLATQLDELKAKVQETEQKMVDYQKRTGIVGTDENSNIYVSQLDIVAQQLSHAEADRIVKEAKYRISLTASPEALGGAGIPEGALPLLRSQEIDLRNALTEATSRYGDKYPKVIELRSQLQQVMDGEKKELSGIQARLRSDYEMAQRTERSLRESLNAHKQDAIKVSDGFSQYGILRRELDSERDLYEDLLKRLKEAGVIAGLRSTNVDVVDAARVPTSPISPKLMVDLMFGFGLGLVVGIGLAFLVDSVDQRLTNPDEIEAVAKLPTLAMVPHFRNHAQTTEAIAKRNGAHCPLLTTEPNGAFAESFRSLRSSLLLACPGAAPKVIVVTSALPSEGKSTISINCALALATQGRRVLLMDADLRRGKISRNLGMNPPQGLSAVLSGTSDWRDVIVDVPQSPSLKMIAAGVRPPNPAELLCSEEIVQLLEEIQPHFDHIVIDTAPVAAVTDAYRAAQAADAVLFVARAGFSLRRSVTRARDILGSIRASVSGVVVNDFDVHRQYYGYSYGYGYGYGKYYADIYTKGEKTETATAAHE